MVKLLCVKIGVKCGDENLTGCHPHRAGIGLREGSTWTNTGTKLLIFDGDGYIYGRSRENSIQSYNTNTWYKIKIKYDKVSDNEIKITKFNLLLVFLF